MQSTRRQPPRRRRTRARVVQGGGEARVREKPLNSSEKIIFFNKKTRAAPKLSPPKSACAGDAVLRTSTRGTVPMGQCAGCHRGHDARVAHGSERRRSHFLGDCWGHKIRRDRSGSQFGHRLYPTPQLRRTVKSKFKSPPDSTFDTIHAKSGSGERLGRTV